MYKGNSLYTPIVNPSPFSNQQTYEIGDFVTYGQTTYECVQRHESSAWDATHFVQRTIGDGLNGKANKADSVSNSALSGEVVPESMTQRQMNTLIRQIALALGATLQGNGGQP